jgi:hypothetical protein
MRVSKTLTIVFVFYAAMLVLFCIGQAMAK